MFLQKAIVILIGNNGIIIANSNGKDIEQKFIESLNDGNRVELINFFKNIDHKKFIFFLILLIRLTKKRAILPLKNLILKKLSKEI